MLSQMALGSAISSLTKSFVHARLPKDKSGTGYEIDTYLFYKNGNPNYRLSYRSANGNYTPITDWAGISI